MDVKNRQKKILTITILLLCITMICCFTGRDHMTAYVAHIINEQTHPALFILLFILLPIIGFPIIIFLVLLGIKFGIETGMLIMFLCMPIHLSSSFLLANNFFKPAIESYVNKKGYRLPQLSEDRYLWVGFVFMAVPGLSYTMKNYIFALSGTPFRYYFLIGVLVNSVMGIPFVIAGDAVVGKSFLLLTLVFLFLLGGYGVSLWIKKQYFQRYFRKNS